MTRSQMRARKALAGLVVAGALTAAGAVPAGASVGPDGHGAAAMCVPVPAASHTTPQGGPGYGFTQGPPASGQGYDHVACPGP
jgi:hypothetical protein